MKFANWFGLLAALSAVLLISAGELPSGWTLDLFRDAQTLEFYTSNAAGEGHWSTVWVVVIDGAPYLRLGTRSASRINGNANSPYVKIRVGGQEFDRVIAQSAPDMADKVGAAMADKYWSDIFIRYARHVLIIRLVPAPPH
jgi:hypothetical protein